MSPRAHEEEPIGEEPHLDPEMIAIVRRAVRELQPTVNYTNGNGYKLAFVLLGVLVTAATDPSIYHGMTHDQKDAVDIIGAKAPADLTQDDVNRLLVILAGVCGC